eukprot:SAG11_NODE_359_length_10228_cov_7.861388_3_plen_310_part_00
MAFARYLIASDEVVRKGHGENNKLNRPVSVTRRYIFDQQSAGRMQQYSLPKFFEIVMTEDDIIGTSTDYLRCSYHDCYGTTNQTSLVDPESRAVDMAAVAHLIAVTRPRTRLDAYPMLLLAKDLISHMLRDDIEVNKQLEAKLSAQVSELALVNKGRAELESSIAELRQSSASRITELEQQIAEVEKSRDSISLLLADVKNEANRSRKTTNPGTSTARRVKFEPSIPKSNEDSAAILEQMAGVNSPTSLCPYQIVEPTGYFDYSPLFGSLDAYCRHRHSHSPSLTEQDWQAGRQNKARSQKEGRPTWLL